jgi:mevalonate kinase
VAASFVGEGRGKVILLGEHSVVYGRPALAASLGAGARAEADGWPTGARLEVEPWGVAFEADAPQADPRSEQLRSAFLALLDGYVAGTGERPRIRVRACVTIPGSAGLGGSAALSVAIVRALDAALGLTRSPAEVADAALAAERVFHGNPSGIDTAMAAGAGVARYVKGRPLAAVRLAQPLRLVVGHSGEPGSTKQTVTSVGHQHAREPARLEQTFDAIAALVDSGQRAVERGALRDLGQLFTLNQKLLNTLLLSTSRLEEMCQAADAAGALGSKLTGGGGGGCMIALVQDQASAERVLAALRALGREAFTAEVSG